MEIFTFFFVVAFFFVYLQCSIKMGKTLAADVKTLFRIIQSIPSPEAESFKQWLAQVGYEWVLEIENPQLTQERMKDLYEKKGYSKDWIEKRPVRLHRQIVPALWGSIDMIVFKN